MDSRPVWGPTVRGPIHRGPICLEPLYVLGKLSQQLSKQLEDALRETRETGHTGEKGDTGPSGSTVLRNEIKPKMCQSVTVKSFENRN